MTRYADPSVCPDCSARLEGSPVVCPRCRLPLHHPLTSELFATLVHADDLLGQLRALAPALPITVPITVPAQQPAGSFIPPLAPLPTAAPAAPAARRRGLRPASVPAVLLGLGALCLLVAAVIFLAVAWSWLGVGGRTGVLAALTVTAAVAGAWLARRGLRIAGEALSAVAFGLLTLDLVGADRAGWLGDLSSSELVLVVGLALFVAGLAWSLGQPSLAVPQVVAALGLLTAYAATVDLADHPSVTSAVAVVAFAALAAGGRARRLPVLPWAALLAALPCWLVLSLNGLAEALDEPTLAALWAVRRTGLGPVGSRRGTAPAGCGGPRRARADRGLPRGLRLAAGRRRLPARGR